VSDIFISYATVDRRLAVQLASFLEEHGYSVWWDRDLNAGEQFYIELARALAGCRLAIVIWTASSVESRWVLGEADSAASAEKLIPVRDDALPDRDLPIGFRALHTIALSDRSGLLRAISTRLEAAPPKRLSRRQVFKVRLSRWLARTRQQMTLGKMAIVVPVMAVIIYFAVALAHWLSIRDSMEPSDFSQHISTFRFSPFVTLAKSKLAGLDEWDAVEKSRSVEQVQEYVGKYPNSLYRPFLILRLSRMQAIASGKYSPVLPQSFQRVLLAEELTTLTDCRRLWFARNEIYYAAGYCFKGNFAIKEFKTRLECPFNDCKMINKFNALSQDVLSNTENKNISMLASREEDLKCPKIPIFGPCD
jgi:hypothetical protein